VPNGNIAYVDAKVGKGVRLHGVSSAGGPWNPDFIRVPNSSSLKFNNEMTVSYYVRFDGTTSMDGGGNSVAGSWGSVFSKSGDRAGFWTMDHADTVNFAYDSYAGGAGINATGQPSAVSSFRYVTYVVSSGNAKIYVNGALASEKTMSVNFTTSNSQDIYIGTQFNLGSHWFGVDGTIDELRVYNRALSSSEVQQLAGGGSSTPSATGKLNDTGINWWANATTNNLTGPQADFPGQDADYGRDKTNNDDSDGHAGFSFTKIGANGEVLPVVAATWYAVKDNVTGLMWENKTDDGGLHDKDNTYSWYEPDNTKNGGSAGTLNGGSCPEGNCDTYHFVQAVDAENFCGKSDWRMPTRMELVSIVNHGTTNPSIDTLFFPNTVSDVYWSSSPSAVDYGAWHVYFGSGDDGWDYKNVNYHIRLVRSASAVTVAILTSIAPLSGRAGSTVELAGTGFSAVLADNTVYFTGDSGAIPANAISGTSTKIVVPVPAGAKTGNVWVKNNAGTSNTVAFTVITALW